MPSNVTIEISGLNDVPPGETRGDWKIQSVITPVAPWTADDYADCWKPVGKLQRGAWADNSGEIGGAAVAPYDHDLALAGEPQLGTTVVQDCNAIFFLNGTDLEIPYSVTNDPNDPPPLPPWYTNPSSITGTVEVTWERV